MKTIMFHVKHLIHRSSLFEERSRLPGLTRFFKLVNQKVVSDDGKAF